ncbi:MAG TPA: hypothetical protein VMJ10_22065, partial [Kofleriaceae bacterium]|nr:hypothetical protein [Kofleriaceae bacterium]
MIKSVPVFLTASLLAVSPARAQAPAAGSSLGAPTEIVSTTKPTEVDAKTAIQGWNPFLTLTASMNVVDNSSVIGQVDGTAMTVAAGVSGGADYIHDRHNLIFTGLINEGYARTPVIDEFVKITDVAKVDGIYNYFVTPNFGGYGRLALATSLFNSRYVVAAPSTFVDVTGKTPVTLATSTQTFHLADAFQPFTMTESAGGFFDPINRHELSLSFRIGIGGRSTFASGAYAIHPNAMDTTAIELLELSDVEQLGIEGFAGITGKLAEKDSFAYAAGVAVLLPFVNNDSYDRSATELTRVAATTNLTYAFSKWLSVVYNLSIIRDPELYPAGKDQIQIQNALLLTLQLGLVTKKEGPKPKTKEQLALEAAQADAAKAAREAAELKAKVHALESQCPATTPPAAPATPPPTPTEPPPATP